jgi:hypothetical protein
VAKELVRDKIVAIWLHFWLRRIARKYPTFFMQILEDVVDSEKGKTIMKARYIERCKFKQIPGLVHLELRQVYKIHQDIIKHIIHL